MANALVKKTGIYFIGNMAAKATSALIIPIYAFFVSADNLGSYDYFITIAQMLSPLCFLAIWESILRYVMREEDMGRKNRLVSASVVFSVSAFLIITAIGIVASIIFPDLMASILSVCLMSSFVGVAQVWQYFARSFGKTKLYAISGVTSALISFFGVLIFVCAMNMQLEGLVLSYVLSQLSIIFLIELKLHVLQLFSIRSAKAADLTALLRFSAPLAMNLLLLAFVTGFGRILITNTLGSDQNGLYTFAMKFGTILTSIGSIFAMAVVEEAILRIGKPDADRFFQKVTSSTVYMLVGLGGFLLPCIYVFYQIISDTAYISSLILTPIFLAYGMCTVLSTVVGCVFQTAQKTNVIALTSALAAVVTTVLSALLLPLTGIIGVSFGLFAGAFSMLLSRYFFGRKLIFYRLFSLKNTVLVLLYILSSCCVIYNIVSQCQTLLPIWILLSCVIFVPSVVKGVQGLRSIPDTNKE